MGNEQSYYTDDDLSTWERIKKAFANDWEQTKADFGASDARDMDQDVDDTVKQAAGSEDAFENHEQAFRFGHTARRRYESDYPDWDEDLESRLQREYDGDYESDKRYIQHAYRYKPR
jgi:hypothetical protein